MASLRHELTREISAGFAAAYLPEEVDAERLLRPDQSAHVLMYEFVECTAVRWHGYCVWIPPGSAPWIEPIDIDDEDCLGLLGSLGGDHMHDYVEVQLRVDAGLWTALARQLLPVGLAIELTAAADSRPEYLVIVPGERLAFLPWAALLLDEHDMASTLIHKAILQIAPSLSSLTPQPAPAQGKVLGYIDATTAGAAEHRRRLAQAVELVPVGDRDEFIRELDRGGYAGAYLTAHGNGVGLTQRIEFRAGGVLSTASALAHPWPAWVLFASCFVGKVEQQTGREPFGLAVACLIGGCRGLVGGIVEVEQQATAALAVDVAAAVSAGTALPVALRQAQLRTLATYRAAATLHQWAGLLCICVDLP